MTRTVLVVSTLAAFAVNAAPPKEIKLGAVVPLTGTESKSGGRLRDGYQLGVELANQQGGVDVGGTHLPVKLVLVDDKSEAAADERAVEELAVQGVDVMLGTFGSSLVEKGSAVAEKMRVPYVAATGASKALYQRGFKYLFGLQSPVEQLGNALMRWVDEEQQRGHLPAPARIALVWEKTSHGKEYAGAIKDFVGKTPRRRAAWKVVLDESFEMNTKDFRPALERLKAVNADVVFVDAHLPDYITMHGQYAKMGLCHKMISYGARGPEREARDQLKSAADYVSSAVWWSDEMAHNARTEEFVKKFNERYNRSADWYEALGYEGVRVAMEAIHRAGTRDRSAVRNAIAQLKMESLLPGGFLAFPDQYGGQAQYLFVVQQNLPDGSAPVIYPRIAAVKEGVAPNPLCAGSKVAGK
jgi:branched-chain amino acid transport system substrate-binding protein